MLISFLTTKKHSTNYRVRRINYAKDTLAIGGLLIDSFSEILALEEVSLDAYVTLIKKLRLFLWIAETCHSLISKFRETFVWIEQEKIIGCITIQRLDIFDKTQWVLCNAAIEQSYPTRDYTLLSRFRTLYNASVEHARKMGARSILADVRDDNLVAYKWCRRTGFSLSEEEITYRWKPYYPKDINIGDQIAGKKLCWRKFRITDWGKASFLKIVEFAEHDIRPTSILKKIFNTKLIDLISNIAHIHKTLRLVLNDKREIVAILTIKLSLKDSSHKMEAITSPEYKGLVETSVIHKALEVLKRYPVQTLLAKAKGTDPNLGTALEEFGFGKISARHRMVLPLTK